MRNTNGKLLNQLRVKSGLTQSQLSRKSGLSQALISGVEVGTRELTDDSVEAITDALGVPRDYFATTIVTGYRGGDVPATYLQEPSRMQADSLAIEFGEIEHAVAVSEDAPNPLSLFQFTFTNQGGKSESLKKVDQAGRLIRDLAGAPRKGPISDVTKTAEGVGIVVAEINRETNPPAVLSSPARNLPAVIMENRVPTGDEQRFAIAREMMRLCLTDTAENVISNRTLDKVTCAFLVPGHDMRRHVTEDSPLDYYSMIKASTGVPIHRLIDWARDCKAISPSRRKQLLTHFNSRGWNLQEPVEVPRESPSLIHDIVTEKEDETVISVDFKSRTRKR